jgi:hypothetical protein
MFKSWAKVLKDNKSWIISAVSKAQKAFDMIINKPNEYDTKTEAIASVKQDRKPRMSDVKVTKPETEIVVEDAEELEICF